jgi:hypothetical protein
MSFGNLPGDEAPEDLPHIELDRLPGDENYDPTDTDGEGVDEMPWCKYGGHRQCYGEDCVCCEVFIEQRQDAYGPSDDYDDRYRDDNWDTDDYEDDVDESMDGDWDTGMASAGFGTDEDYGFFGGGEE